MPLGRKAEAPVITGIAEHEDPSDAVSRQPLEPIANDRAADPLMLMCRSNGKRSQQRDFILGSDNAAMGEHAMTGHIRAIGADKR